MCILHRQNHQKHLDRQNLRATSLNFWSEIYVIDFPFTGSQLAVKINFQHVVILDDYENGYVMCGDRS